MASLNFAFAIDLPVSTLLSGIDIKKRTTHVFQKVHKAHSSSLPSWEHGNWDEWKNSFQYYWGEGECLKNCCIYHLKVFLLKPDTYEGAPKFYCLFQQPWCMCYCFYCLFFQLRGWGKQMRYWSIWTNHTIILELSFHI